jgi:hypothetical protein
MYRDPDTSALATFAKHVQIAEALYVINLEHLEHPHDVERRQAYGLSWIQLWEQVGAARAIAVMFGRDVSAVDMARRRGNPDAVDLYLSRGNRDAALRAFAEIRRCMPEVVVPTEIPGERRELPRRRGERLDVMPTWASCTLAVVLAVICFLPLRC